MGARMFLFLLCPKSIAPTIFHAPTPNNVGRRMSRFKPARYNRGTVFWRPLIGPRLV